MEESENDITIYSSSEENDQILEETENSKTKLNYTDELPPSIDDDSNYGSNTEHSFGEGEVFGEESIGNNDTSEIPVQSHIETFSTNELEYGEDSQQAELEERILNDEEEDNNIVISFRRDSHNPQTLIPSSSGDSPVLSKPKVEIDRLAIVPPKLKPCSRGRMIKWLNRHANENPVESFLGKPYRKQHEQISATDPCHNILFNNTFKPQIDQNPSKLNKHHKACKCAAMSSIQQREIPKHTSRSRKNITSIPSQKLKRKNKMTGSHHCVVKSSSAKLNQRTPSSYKKNRRPKKSQNAPRWCNCKPRSTFKKWFNRMKNETHNIMYADMLRRKSMMKNNNINELFKAIGPELSSGFKELLVKQKPPKRKVFKSVNGIMTKKIKKQMEMFEIQKIKDGNCFSEYDKDDCERLQYVELPNGSCYFGQFSAVGMEGKCIYKMTHGPIFVGYMIDGMMEGHGRLIYPSGSFIDGIWVNGTLFSPEYTFSDGLKFEPKNWKYCCLPDRRYASEIKNGMSTSNDVQICANRPARKIPKGCFDAGEGFYDPKLKVILHPTTGKIMRILNERERYIMKDYRRACPEEVSFVGNSHTYAAKTLYQSPGDECDWFEREFPNVILPYSDVNDVLLARKCAMQIAISQLNLVKN